MANNTDFLGLRVIKALVAKKDITLLDQLKLEDFLPGTCRDIYALVLDYAMKFNAMPLEQAIEDDFGKVLPDDLEDFTYLHEQLLKRNLTYKLTKNLENVAALIDNNDPEAAYKQLTDLVATGAIAPEKKVISYVKDNKVRIEQYKEAVSNKVFDGIPITSWEELNKIFVGWVNGTLNVILASQGTGKTWSLCVVANDCLNLGKKILFVTMEMPSIRIMRRLDALRYKVSFGKMRNNTLTDDDVKRWEDAAALDTSTGDVVVADKQQIRTTQDVFGLVRKHKPDIVLIDGAYRFTDSSSYRSQWESSARIVTDLQLFAEATNIPWIVTSQLNVDPKKAEGGKIQIQDARYSKEWGIAADIVLGLQQAPEDRLIRRMQVHILKVREHDMETNTDMVMIHWDLVNWKFDEIALDLNTAGYVP